MCCMYVCNIAYAQEYPEPTFSNEVYYLSKGSIYTVTRLDKDVSKLEVKTKMGGIAGMEQGYIIENATAKMRLPDGRNLSFIFSTGSSVKVASPQSDSLMKTNGMDPDKMQNMMNMNNPLNNIILYKVEIEKDKRKIIMQKSGGAFSPNTNKTKSSDKFTFSIKRIREGYSELVIDKSLPKGEYAFSVPQNGMGGMGGDVLLFSFGID